LNTGYDPLGWRKRSPFNGYYGPVDIAFLKTTSKPGDQSSTDYELNLLIEAPALEAFMDPN